MSNLEQYSVSIKAARQLTNTSKTSPQMLASSPKYLLKMLPWEEVPGGTYRINRTKLIFKSVGRIGIEFEGGAFVIKPADFREVPLFSSLNEAMLEAMISSFKVETVERGIELCKEGEDKDKFYVIANGACELVKTGQYGEELVIKTIGPGDFFGEEELVSDMVAPSTVRTLTDCTFMTLHEDDLTNIFEVNSELKAPFEKEIERMIKLREKANEFGDQEVELSSGHIGETDLPLTYVDYIEEPIEIPMNLVQTVLRVHTRVSDLYNDPINQLEMQMGITMAYMWERQEWELINNPEYGLLANAHPSMRLQTRGGSPTPDDMDALLSLVWKAPSFFLAHPRAIAAFERECTWRGVPPTYEVIDGIRFIQWRGVPLIPSEKVEIDGSIVNRHGPGRTSILLIRAGGQDVQGVSGLYQTGIPGEVAPGLSVRLMDIDRKAIANYLMTLYFSLAIHTEDAAGVLENVEVGYYHDYTTRTPKVK
jgi:CRP-like cAMP-binding protein